jgi:hypothetical protein
MMAGVNGGGINGSMKEDAHVRASPNVSGSESEEEGRMMIVWEGER